MDSKGTQPHIQCIHSPPNCGSPTSRLPLNTEQSSLCYTIGPCWLCIVNIAVTNIIFPRVLVKCVGTNCLIHITVGVGGRWYNLLQPFLDGGNLATCNKSLLLHIPFIRADSKKMIDLFIAFQNCLKGGIIGSSLNDLNRSLCALAFQ